MTDEDLSRWDAGTITPDSSPDEPSEQLDDDQEGNDDEERPDPCDDCGRRRKTVKQRHPSGRDLCAPCHARREGLNDAFPGGSV
jgi:hypothetical protein